MATSPAHPGAGAGGQADDAVVVSPFHRRDLTLAGFVLSGRWPRSTGEWAQVLLLAVRLAAVPGLVPRTELFRALEQLPDDPAPGTVGLLACEGPIVGEADRVARPRYEDPPPALFVLHPPAETRRRPASATGAASGAILLPGLPHLGLAHRAAWVEAEADGTVARLVSDDEVDVRRDPDLAVMASFLAA